MKYFRSCLAFAVVAVLLIAGPVITKKANHYSEIPKDSLARVKQLASEIDNVVANVQNWMKVKLMKDITEEQTTNVRAIATQYLLIDSEQAIKFERVWYVMATSYWESNLQGITERRSHKYGSYIWDIQNRYFYTEFQGRGFC